MVHCTAALVVASLALQPAGEPAATTTGAYDFQGAAIDAELLKPDGALIQTAPRFQAPPDLNGEIRRLIQRAKGRVINPRERLELARLLVDRSRRRFVRAMGHAEAEFDARERRDARARADARTKKRYWLAAEARDRRAAVVQLRRIPASADRETERGALELHLYLLSYQDLDNARAETVIAQRIAQSFPNTPLAAQAHVRVGDRRFDDSQLTVAAAAYGAAIVIPRATATIVSYAHYKRAWVWFNLGEFSKAIVDFKAARRIAAGAGSSGRSMRREAARDIVLVLAAMDWRVEYAVALIRELGDDRAQRERLAKRLSTLLVDAARDKDANDFTRAFAQPPARRRDAPALR